MLEFLPSKRMLCMCSLFPQAIPLLFLTELFKAYYTSSLSVLYHFRVELILIIVFKSWNFRNAPFTLMWLYTDFATHYVYNHVHNGLKLSVGNYCTWLYSILGYPFVLVMSHCHVTVIESFLHVCKAHSQHSCGACTNVWGRLASLVTKGLQLQDSSIIAGSWIGVDLPSFMF